jgi:hypothetical protein
MSVLRAAAHVAGACLFVAGLFAMLCLNRVLLGLFVAGVGMCVMEL